MTMTFTWGFIWIWWHGCCK